MQHYTRVDTNTPSKRPFESLEPEIINSAQVMGQESNENFNPQPEIMRTPSPTSLDEDTLLHTPNKRQMCDWKVIQYLDVMKHSLKYNRVHVQAPPMWTKIENYLENALKKSGRDFKKAIMLEIKGDDENKFRLYSKLTKSPTSSGIVKLDAKGVRLFDDKEIWHMEVAGPPSSPTTDHAVCDTKKSLHSDILNLVALLLDHLDIPVKAAMNIKVFSLQVISYRITLYSLNMIDDGTFLASELASAIIPFSFEGRSKYKAVLYLMFLLHGEFMKQLSIMQELDFTINRNEGVTVRDVLRIPKSLKDLLQLRQYS
ncbi:1062_t:CDS:2 [Entrophospora sp. SA101]|nr:3137_t:CDS:2 [Entrophospora sp. SA101]CAJ0902972.1 1062_t:CDS:2 [Entrophospora sp. SA101]